MYSTTVIIDPTNSTITAQNWKICQQRCCRPAKTDLLSEFVDPAEECHMTLEPDDAQTIALKEQKRRKNSHKRQGSDLTAATEAMSLALDYDNIDLSFLDDIMKPEAFCVPEEPEGDDDISLLQDEDDVDYSCVDDAIRIVLDYPCSDEEEDEYMPLYVR